VIVEHYTASDSAVSAWNTFANDAPYLGELPGVCAQFIVDRDGAIWELTSPTIECRHTVGLNWTAIGIENVGTSDTQILGDAQQMKSSLALTLWLMEKYHVSIGNVIGHSESIWSPYYREHVASYRCLNHSDWLHADMVTYRSRLAQLARHYHVPLGSGYKAVDNGC
jgi:beta-N-acetylhexosaminidase